MISRAQVHEDALDVVVYDPPFVQKLDAGEKGAEPGFGVVFGDFDGD